MFNKDTLIKNGSVVIIAIILIIILISGGSKNKNIDDEGDIKIDVNKLKITLNPNEIIEKAMRVKEILKKTGAFRKKEEIYKDLDDIYTIMFVENPIIKTQDDLLYFLRIYTKLKNNFWGIKFTTDLKTCVRTQENYINHKLSSKLSSLLPEFKNIFV